MARSSKKQFFYFEKLRPWEISVAVIYALLSVALFTSGKWPMNADLKMGIIYTLGIQLCFVLFFYHSLRNLTFYLFWFLIGIVHLLIYLFINGEYYQQMMHIHKPLLPELRNTLFLLVLFQGLRWLSIKIQHKEFVMPARGDNKDLFDKRVTTWTDLLIIGIYVFCLVGLSAIA